MLGKRDDWQTVDVEIERRARVGRAELKIIRDLARDLQKLTETLAESRATSTSPRRPSSTWSAPRSGSPSTGTSPSVPRPAGFPAPCFRLPELPGAWAAARNDGLYHPITREERPVTFDRDAAAERTDVVLLHLGHRLVQMCLRLLRAELWADRPQDRERARPAPGHRPHRPHRHAARARRRRPHPGRGHRRGGHPAARGGRPRGRHHRGGQAGPRPEDEPARLAGRLGRELPPDQVTEHLAELWPTLSGPLTGFLDAPAGGRRRSLSALHRDIAATRRSTAMDDDPRRA